MKRSTYNMTQKPDKLKLKLSIIIKNEFTCLLIYLHVNHIIGFSFLFLISVKITQN